MVEVKEGVINEPDGVVIREEEITWTFTVQGDIMDNKVLFMVKQWYGGYYVK